MRYLLTLSYIRFRGLTPMLPVILLCLVAVTGCKDETRDDRIRASGTIEATEVKIATRVTGQIRSLTVDEGSTVSAGDTLAVIDHDLIALQVAQIEAGTEAAEARLALLREGARSEDVAQAEAGLTQVEAQLDQARQDAERMRTLFNSGSATRKQLDDAETRLSIVQSQADAARENVRKVKSFTRPAELRAAAAQVRQSQASGDVLKRQIEDAFIVAPINGVVTEKSAEAGELATQGAALVTIVRMDPVYLRIYVPEDQLGKIRLGQSVEVFTDSYPDQPQRGRVTFISPEAEFTPKNVQTQEERIKLVYEIKVEVPNAKGILKPGMYADAEIRFDSAPAQP